MPLSALQATLLQSAVLGGVSNVLAQSIVAHRQGLPVTVNWIPVLQFILFNAVSAPLNFLWQELLENSFPAYPALPGSKKADEKPVKPRLSKRNTAIKLCLDQTFSAAFNTLLFSVFNRSLKAAMPVAPKESNIFKAVALFTSPGFINFTNVNFSAVWEATKEDFLPVLIASWKIWPAVVLFNFTMVKTIQMRGLVLALAGLGWRVYLSMVAAD